MFPVSPSTPAVDLTADEIAAADALFDLLMEERDAATVSPLPPRGGSSRDEDLAASA